MITFNRFEEKHGFEVTPEIGSNVCVTETSYPSFAGMWTVGLEENATHKGTRLYESKDSFTWSKSRSRWGKPTKKLMEEMRKWAKILSNKQ